MEAVAFEYGAFYDQVCFECGTGTQFCRANPVRVRAKALTLWRVRLRPQSRLSVRYSYEEHVIYVTEGFATRADPKDDAKNPARHFNRNQNGHPPENL